MAPRSTAARADRAGDGRETSTGYAPGRWWRRRTPAIATPPSPICCCARSNAKTPRAPRPPLRPRQGRPPPRPSACPRVSLVSALDLTQSVDAETYAASLRDLQQRLGDLATSKKFARRGLVAVFEGNDAAGKGGAIRRVRAALDPRRFRVHGVAAPTDEEHARPYLWRFWRNIPRLGNVAIFDRSWYGRVLVERVEGFCSREDWMRAYQEINDFEGNWRGRLIVVKFCWRSAPTSNSRG